MGVKKMLWMLCDSKLRPPKDNKRKKLLNCDVIVLNKHLCILNNNTNKSTSIRKIVEEKLIKK